MWKLCLWVLAGTSFDVLCAAPWKLPNPVTQRKSSWNPLCHWVPNAAAAQPGSWARSGEAVPSLCARDVVFTKRCRATRWDPLQRVPMSRGGGRAVERCLLSGGHCLSGRTHGACSDERSMEGVGQSSVGLFPPGFLSWQSLRYMRNRRSAVFFR